MQVPVKLNPYWLLLKDLDTAEKLSLIELLVKSIQSAQTTSSKNKPGKRMSKNEDWVQSFAGSWNDFPESAEEMIAIIEGARTLGRKVEPL